MAVDVVARQPHQRRGCASFFLDPGVAAFRCRLTGCPFPLAPSARPEIAPSIRPFGAVAALVDALCFPHCVESQEARGLRSWVHAAQGGNIKHRSSSARKRYLTGKAPRRGGMPEPIQLEDMMRRMRRGGLVRVAATTAVVAGTAGAVSHHQQQKYAGQQANAQQQADMEQMAQQQALQQQQLEQMQQQQAAPPPPPAPAPQAAPGPDLTAQLQQLAQLHTAGVLSDEEFAAAKAKLLGG